MPTRGRRFNDSLRAVKFCPWCSSNDIQRDDFNPAAITKTGEQRDHGLRAWVCNSCFQGYVVKLSPRAEYARYMIRQDAKLRPQDFEATECVKISRHGVESDTVKTRALETIEKLARS